MFKQIFNANTFTRVECKSWMSDSHIRPMITPTITMKAAVVNDFPHLDEEVGNIEILKLNISSKVIKSIQNNRNERKYTHLNN